MYAAIGIMHLEAPCRNFITILVDYNGWSGGWGFVPIRPSVRTATPFLSRGDPGLTCSRAALIFLDKLPRRRQHFAALVYEFRFEGASAQDFAGIRAINLRERKKVLAIPNLSAIIYQVAPKRV